MLYHMTHVLRDDLGQHFKVLHWGHSDYGSLIWKTRNEYVTRSIVTTVIYGNGCVRLYVHWIFPRAAFSGLTRILSGTYVINVKYFLCRCTHEFIVLPCSTAVSSQGSRVIVQVTAAFHVLSNLQERRSVSASSPRSGSEKILTHSFAFSPHS